MRPPAVILGTDARVNSKPLVNILLCTSQRATRKAEAHEIILNGEDGLEWETLCKCDLIYVAEKSQLKNKRGSVTVERRREIVRRVIQQLGLAGF